LVFLPGLRAWLPRPERIQTLLYFDDRSRAESAAPRFQRAASLAIDSEAAGFHRYSDSICLIQLSTPAETFILDPLAFEVSDLLRGPLEDPSIPVLMHGGDYDMRLLDRDLSIRPVNLFDTQIAAQLLGEPAIGLSALLDTYLGVTLAKKYQRADWAERPLSDGMLQYAAADTQHLHALADLLRGRLEEKGRMDWAEEEFRRMEEIRWVEEAVEDPVQKVKRARDLSPREITRLRYLLEWRDGLARERDKAPFRIAGDPALIEVARSDPRSTKALAETKGFPTGLAFTQGDEILAELDRIRELPESELQGLPRPPRRGPGRPTPEEEDRIARLKGVRNRMAESLGLARGTLLSNGLLEALGRASPASLQEMESVPDLRLWQVRALGPELLKVMQP
jgi:ribonuclease D